MKRQTLLAACAAVAFALGASAAAAATDVDVTVYNGYNDNGNGITFTGPATATGSFATAPTGFDYNWNNPGTIGGYDASDYFSADFRGTLVANSAGTYTINLGSDDAAYLYVNNVLAASDGGEHSYNPSDYTINLNAGVNDFEIQYGNGPCCGAEVSLGTVTSGLSVAGVPEPATWALMLGGLGLVGAGLRINRRKAPMALPA